MNSTRISLFDSLPTSLISRIEREFHRSHGPLLLGEISAAVGWSLERTEQAVEALISNGKVRHATSDERVARDLREDANAYVIACDKSSLNASW